MFVYLRYFYAASLVIVLLAAYFIGSSVRSMTSDTLFTMLEKHDEAVVQQYLHHVWRPYYPHGVGAGPDRYHRMEDFRNRSEQFFSKQPKLRFVLSNHSGREVFRLGNAALLNADEQDIGVNVTQSASARVKQSQVLSDIRNASTDKLSVVMQSLFPIDNPRYDASSPQCPVGGGAKAGGLPHVCYPTLAVIEIVSDVTTAYDNLAMVQYFSTGSIIGIFLLLFSVLFFSTQRAEGIIAKQHEANMELVQAASTAEADSMEKSQFLANISHELRTPLNAIIGFSEILKNEAMADLNPTHQEYIRDINGSGSHLLSLINDILDFSKAEAGKLEIDANELDLSKLLANSMRLVIPRAEQAQVTLVEDMPAEHIVCTTDGKKLKQVILNLLSNAVKFTPAGGEVRVTAWETIADRTIHIVVKDSGIGIAPKDIAKVMSPFGQVESNLSRRYEGTGLGLPLSKKFVEIMGGEFLMESEVGAGTTVTITLPSTPPTGQTAQASDTASL